MKALKIMGITILVIAILWTILTFVVERKGPEKSMEFGSADSVNRALIVYDPDPFYNLDEQISESFAKGLAQKGWFAQVATVSCATKIAETNFDLYIFCANTYNWSPDWAITNYIKKNDALNGKRVVAITLGAGSTEKSKHKLEKIIQDKNVILLSSFSLWLWKPNDKSKLEESNASVAVDKANVVALEIGEMEKKRSTNN